jgi:hypothetical protein
LAMGRPKKAERRDHQLNIHLTGGEFKTITDHALARSMEPVDYGRCVLLDPAHATALPVPAESRFDRLVYLQLQKLGNLLNQLVRHLHQTDELLPEIKPLLHEIRAVLDRRLP